MNASDIFRQLTERFKIDRGRSGPGRSFEPGSVERLKAQMMHMSSPDERVAQLLEQPSARLAVKRLIESNLEKYAATDEASIVEELILALKESHFDPSCMEPAILAYYRTKAEEQGHPPKSPDDHYAAIRPTLELLARRMRNVSIDAQGPEEHLVGDLLHRQVARPPQNIRQWFWSVVDPMLEDGKDYHEVLEFLDNSDRALQDAPIFRKYVREHEIQCWADIGAHPVIRTKFQKVLSRRRHRIAHPRG